jgi:hypothetical protein
MWGKKKEQPQRAAVKVKSGDAVKVISVPIGELPVTLAMVVLPPPGILWSSNRVEGYDRLRVVVRGIQNDFQRRIDKAGQGKPVRLEQEAMNPGFHRMLAKIAHSYAMACIADIGGFQPLLLDIILRNELKDGPMLIGGPDKFTPPSPDNATDTLHKVWITKARHPERMTEPGYMVVCIRLFACFNMPTYQVVVGRELPAQG